MNTTKKVFAGLVVVSMFLAGLTVSTPALAVCPPSPGGSVVISDVCPRYLINVNGSTVEVTSTGSVNLNIDGIIDNSKGNTVIVDKGGTIFGSVFTSAGGASTVNFDGSAGNDIFGNFSNSGAFTAADTANITIGADTTSVGSVEGNQAGTITASDATVEVNGGHLLSVFGNFTSGTVDPSITDGTAFITINAGTVGKVIGGRTFGGSAIANHSSGGVSGSEGTVNIFGGTLLGGAEGNQSSKTLVNSTGTVNISGATVGSPAIPQFIAGNQSTQSISGSTGNVSIDNATIGDYVFGNMSFAGISNSTSIVGISNSSSNGVFGNLANGGNLTDGSTATVTIGAGVTINSNLTDNNNQPLGAVANYSGANIDGTSHLVTGNVSVENGSNVSGAVVGNYADGGNVNTAQASVTVNGAVTGNVVGNGGANVTNGTASMMISQSAVVMGDVYGNQASGTTTNSSSDLTIDGSVFGNVVAGNGSDTATVNPSGMVSGIISGSSSLFAGNPDGNTNVLTLNFGTTTSEADLDSFNGGFGPDGSVIINGKTYTWVNWSSVIGTLQYDKIITWFTSNDGRTDGNAWGRIILYCHADKDTLGVLLVNNQSAGNVGTSFKISKLETLGLPGTSFDFGVNGVLSIEMGHDGNGYAAWNGGVDGATGQGDFARTFVCK